MKAKAYIVHYAMCEPELEWRKPKDCLSAEPLYSKRLPLTDEQIDKLPWTKTYEGDVTLLEALRHYARAIEAAHGIKGDA